MTDTEKLILEKLDTLATCVNAVQENMKSMTSTVTTLRDDLRVIDQRLSDETSKIRLLIENDISLKIDIIGEGHDFLKGRLNDAL